MDSAEEGWSTRLEVKRTHTQMTISGTVSLESGSGVVYIEGRDGQTVEFPVSAEAPAEFQDVAVTLYEQRTPSKKSDAYAVLGVAGDGPLQGISADVSFTSAG